MKHKSGKSTRIISLPASGKAVKFETSGQISITECRNILCKDGGEYNDEEVELVRKLLYALAEVDYQYHFNILSTPATIIPLNSVTNNDEQESYSLCPGINRRTG